MTKIVCRKDIKDCEVYLDKQLKLGYITKEEYDLFWSFIRNRKVKKGKISPNTIWGYFNHLTGWRKNYGIHKEYTECCYEDLEIAIYNLDSTISINTGNCLSQNTRRDYILDIKTFFYFLIENNHSKIEKSKIMKIRPPDKNIHTKLIENIPNQEMIKKMIECALSIRDKAFIHVMYDGGLRPCEMLSMTWNQIQFDTEGGAVVTVCEKTKYPRLVPLNGSVESLNLLRNTYPLKEFGNNHVFLSKYNQPLKDGAMRKQFKEIIVRAGLPTEITPHYLRHARITHYIRNGMLEWDLKAIMWGNQKTTQYETYLHIANYQLVNSARKANGVEIIDEYDAKDHVLDAKRCSICNYINSGISKTCTKCNNPLEVYSSSHFEHFKKIIEKGPESELIMSILQEMASKLNLTPLLSEA